MKIEFGVPDPVMVAHLQHNKHVLAVFSNYSNAAILRDLLLQPDMHNRPYYKYELEAKQLIENLDAEQLRKDYDTATRIARMATIWEKIYSTRRLFPNLRITPCRSANPRPEFKMLEGLVIPITHKFWDTMCPPNYEGDQQSISPTDDDATEIPKTLPLPDAKFRFNPAK